MSRAACCVSPDICQRQLLIGDKGHLGHVYLLQGSSTVADNIALIFGGIDTLLLGLWLFKV